MAMAAASQRHSCALGPIDPWTSIDVHGFCCASQQICCLPPACWRLPGCTCGRRRGRRPPLARTVATLDATTRLL
jgi:hypothetical protein